MDTSVRLCSRAPRTAITRGSVDPPVSNSRGGNTPGAVNFIRDVSPVVSDGVCESFGIIMGVIPGSVWQQ